MFTFTPLQGAKTASTASQSLLELDGGIKILIDVGWDEDFDTHQLSVLEKHIPTISLILLTHATTSHIGAFAHCCKNFPLFTQIPIYATTPVVSLGRTLLQDLYSSAPSASTFLPLQPVADEPSQSLSSSSDSRKSNILLQSPTVDEIATYFALVHPLKYSQPHQPISAPFSPPLSGLTLTAYNAGHSLGGTIWHLQHGMESIVYAVDWNQARENVFSGAAWFGGTGAGGAEVIEQLRNPTALVCSSKGGDKSALAGGRTKRDELLLEMIRSSIAKGGTVLIPTDTSARVLELAYVLEHAWRNEPSDNKRLGAAKLFLASKTAGATMRYAKSMLEWMDDTVARDIEAEGRSDATRSHHRNDSKQAATLNGDGGAQDGGKGGSPFDFKVLKIIERKTQLDRVLANDGPQVILASDSSMEWGFSRESLRKIAQKAENLIIFTEHPKAPKAPNAESGLGMDQILWSWYEERRDGVALEPSSDGTNLEQVHCGGRELEFKDVERASLDVNDQVVYQQYLATQLHLKSAMQTRNATALDASADAADVDDASSSSSSDDSDNEQQGRALNFSTTMAHSSRNKLGMTTEELGVNILTQRKGVHDYDVRGKRGRDRMFPNIGKRKREDDFGDVIRPEEYLRAEERQEVDAEGNEVDMRKDIAPGQKRKWTEVGFSGQNGRRNSQLSNKRHQMRRMSTSDDEHPGFSNGNGEHPDAAVDDESDAETEDDGFKGPSKAIFKISSINVFARLAFVDFSGLHDQRSLQMLIPLIHPRKLVLVGGTETETASLAADCKDLALAKGDAEAEESAMDVFTPSIGEVIDASVDTNAWVVKLSSQLLKQLTWQTVRGLGVVALTGQLAVEDIDGSFNEATSKKQKMMDKDATDSHENGTTKEDAGNLSPVLDILPSTMAASIRSITQPLHVGDLRLADLRKLMQSSGHTAEFRGEGTLLIDGLVVVRKTGSGRVEVEGGGLSDVANRSRRFDGSFVSVRKKIYENLAIVAGG